MQGWCEDHRTVCRWAKEGRDDLGESLRVPCELREMQGRRGGEKPGTCRGAGLREVGIVGLSRIQPPRLRDPSFASRALPRSARSSDSDSLDWEEGDRTGKTMGL